MKDFLPAEIDAWQRLEAMTREVCRRFGYKEIRTPVVEPTELFVRSVGETTDIVEKEMYTFPDRNGQSVTLRPEGTASVVRAAIQHSLVATGEITRLFYVGPMFRYERPQKGRQRQFHQIGIEALGQDRPEVDAEVIDLLMTLLTQIGVGELKLRINSLGCPECRPPYREALIAYLTGIREGLCEDCNRRFAVNPLRVFDCKSERCHELSRRAPVIVDALCAPCKAHFEGVEAIVAASGREYRVDPFMVRGLDYYVRTAFEVSSSALGAQDAVAGGGRYDGLAREIGGGGFPGIGFAAGMERIVMLMPPAPPEAVGGGVYVALIPPATEADRQKVLRELRHAGHAAVTDYGAGSVKAHFRRADRWGCRHVVVVGGEELSRGAVALRDMAGGAQREVPLASLLSSLTPTGDPT
jgi:histidyl-tRNA synthetase